MQYVFKFVISFNDYNLKELMKGFSGPKMGT